MSKDKTAIITGAASGIGLGIARALAEQGLHVVVTDLDGEAAAAAAAGIRAEGFLASSFALNVTSESDIAGLRDFLVESKLSPDVLINNAGIQHVAPIEDFPVDKWRLVNEVLLVGPALITRALLPLMREKGFGRIINIGSIHALVASPYKSAYVAAKHGLIGFSKVVALETADTDVTINTICPAYVKTPLVEKQIADQAKANGISEEEVINQIMLQPMPKKSFIELDEIVAAVNYLASAAARNVTGTQLVLDGGWVAK